MPVSDEAAAQPAPTEPAPQPAPTETPSPLTCMIAFDSERDGNREIYVMGPDGSDPVNLSNDPGDDHHPAWSPDGSQIAFVSSRSYEGEEGQYIFVMSADGSHLRRLTSNPNSDFPDWSDDGSRIVYISNDDVWVMNADGSGQPVNLTNSPEKDRQPLWSPDSSQIAWLRGEEFSRNIFLMNADGSDARQITDDGNVHEIAWTVDGQLFANWESVEHGCCNFVMNADGSQVAPAGGKGEIQRFLPFWTEDGHRIECNDIDFEGNGEEDIYLIGEIFPDALLNITNAPGADRNPVWPAQCGPLSTAAEMPAQKQPEQPGEIILGYTGDDPMQPQRKENFQKACAELGIDCLYAESVTALVDQGVNAIVANSVNEGLHPEIMAARDRGVPVFLLDAELISDGSYSVTIGRNNWAYSGLKWMADAMGGQGEIAFFDLGGANGFDAPIEALLKDYPGLREAARFSGKYDHNNMEADARALAETKPELGAIWASDNQAKVIWGVHGTQLAAEKWPAVLCEPTKKGLEIWQEMLNETPSFNCAIFINPPGIAYDAAYAAYYLASGARLDESVLGGEFGHTLYVNMPVITSTNFAEWAEKVKDESEDYQLDELMSPYEILEGWFVE